MEGLKIGKTGHAHNVDFSGIAEDFISESHAHDIHSLERAEATNKY
jgi:hypothetical protein